MRLKKQLRTVTIINIETGEFLYQIGESKSFVGAFIGLNGITVAPEGNILVTDSEMSSVQAFSKEDGKYLYHLGGKKAIPDPRADNQRPFVRAFQVPAAIRTDSKGRVWIFTQQKRDFAVRQYIGDKLWDITVDKPEGTLPKALKR